MAVTRLPAALADHRRRDRRDPRARSGRRPCSRRGPTTTSRSTPGRPSTSSSATGSPSARAEEVPEPGSFVLRDVFGESVLLVRGRDDVIRAFYNVCRHRGTAVEERECGKAVRFQCPYHAWIYDLDGRLIRAKHVEDLEDFSLETFGLTPIRGRDVAGLRLPLLRRRGDDARPARLHGRLVRPPRRLRARHEHACGARRG